MGIEGSGRVAARLARQVDRALSELKLSGGQYRLLANLSEGPSPANELAELLIISRPSVTALADGLVERELITRDHTPDDRRRVIHVLTTKGERVLTQADAAIETRLADLASVLPDVERKRAVGGFTLWKKALDIARARALGSKEAKLTAAKTPKAPRPTKASR